MFIDFVTSVPKDVYNILTKTEIVSLFGKEHIFELDEYASLICIQRALNKAEMLIDASKEQDCI